MAIGPLPPVISEIQANSGQPGKMLARQQASTSLLDLQTEATTPLTANIVPETTLLEDAVAAALGRQGGLADLYATLTQLSGSPDLPDKVKAAIQQVLAFQLGDGDVTPERLAQAIRSSGLFHEAVAAGKMMAALPQAVRQALGRGADGSARVAIPTAPRGAASPTSQTSAPPATQTQTTQATASPERPGAPSGALASAIASYGRGSATPSQPGATQLAASIAQTTTPAAATTAASAGSPAPAAASPTPAAPSASPTPAVAGQAPAAPQSSSIAVSVGGQPAQTSTPVTVSGEGSPPAPAGQPPAGSSTPQPASQAPQTGTTLPTPPPAPAATPPAASPAAAPPTQTAPTATQQSVPASTPTTGQAQPSQPTSSAGTTQPAPASTTPEPASGTQAAGKSFAPWTPGRPMTPPPVVGQPATGQPSSASTASQTAQSATASTPLSAQPQPEGEASIAVRPATDRPLFVPSSVDSLPSRPAGAPIATAPASPQPAGTPAQPGTAPTAGQAPAPSPQGVAPSTITTQPATPVGAQAVAPSEKPSPGTPTTPAAAQSPAAASPKSEPTPARPVLGSPVQTATQPASQLPIGLDLKGAIDLLRRELIVWLGRSADVMASADGTADDATTARADRPAPPRRNGPVRGQPAVDRGADALDALSTETLAGRALGEAERSLSRVFLHQAATAETRDARAPQAAQAMMMEIPIAGPNGTSIAQLRIERDEHPPSEPGAPPRRVFQVDVAFDIAPLGPVVVRVGLMDGRRVAIGVWCETDDGLVRMEAERSSIVIGLEAEGMTVAGVDLHKGHPPEGGEETATVARNHRLDLQL